MICTTSFSVVATPQATLNTRPGRVRRGRRRRPPGSPRRCCRCSRSRATACRRRRWSTPLPRQAGRDEARDHRRVLGLRILARAEHVEVAQADGLEPVGAREHLRSSARPPASTTAYGDSGAGRHRLDLGQRRRVAVGGRRRGVDDAPHAGASSPSCSRFSVAGDVGVVAGERVRQRTRHRRDGRLVEHDLDAGAGARHRRRVAHVALDELDVARHLGQVLALAREEVVEDANPVAARQQRAHDGRADEPGAAGDRGTSSPCGQPSRTAARRTVVGRLPGNLW